MSASKILITGGSGFIAARLAAAWRAAGREVTGVDQVADPAAGVLAGDVTDPGAWREALAGVDTVVHTAALVSNNMTARRAFDVNVAGTDQVIRAAVDCGAKRFVLVSSVAASMFAGMGRYPVRGLPAPVTLNEDSPVVPTANPYGDSKIAAEHVALTAHLRGEIETTVIRPADVYGPGSRPWVVEPLKLMRSGQFMLPAAGRGIFCPVHVDDLVRGMITAAESDAAAGQIFILGGENPVECRTYFGYLWSMLGKSGEPRAVPYPVAAGIAEIARHAYRLARRPTEVGAGAVDMLARVSAFDNTKAHRVLGWHEQVTLDDGMREVQAWAAEQGLLA